jgi:hypothetical protein
MNAAELKSHARLAPPRHYSATNAGGLCEQYVSHEILGLVGREA